MRSWGSCPRIHAAHARRMMLLKTFFLQKNEVDIAVDGLQALINICPCKDHCRLEHPQAVSQRLAVHVLASHVAHACVEKQNTL